jgi:HlyD family secretion protein
VEQVRLNPVVLQNVVTYAAIITAPNPELKLKPGMTANLNVEVARRDGVLRVPSAALRFHPGAEVLKALDSSAAVGATQAGGVTTLWQWRDGVLEAIAVKTGISDGSVTEIVSPDVVEGTEIVTRVVLPADAAAPSPRASSPLMPSAPARR